MRPTAGRVAAAILLPPFAVHLSRGDRRDFAIACGLTVLGFIPGTVFALWTVSHRVRDGAPDTV